ncbi:MAG: hypothetical protein LBH98_04270 [Chitinispirillales bacterium]|jgi:hypothetical protein|nr:hypothetical protein [Chitinispirillales bacterium]
MANKLDEFVQVEYKRSINNFADAVFDTVAIYGGDGIWRGDENPNNSTGSPKEPLVITSVSQALSLNITKPTIDIISRVLQYAPKCVLLGDNPSNTTGASNYYLNLIISDNVVPTNFKMSEADEEGNFNYNFFVISKKKDGVDTTITKWEKFSNSQLLPGEGLSHLAVAYYKEEWGADKEYDEAFIAASVAGVIAGNVLKGFTTYLRPIRSLPLGELRQNGNAMGNQDYAIGAVRLGKNYFVEGSKTVKVEGTDVKPDEYIDRVVLADQLQARLQEAILRVLAANTVPYTAEGAEMLFSAGMACLSNYVSTNVITDLEGESGYENVTTEDIESRIYGHLVYRFRFAGAIEAVKIVLEV